MAQGAEFDHMVKLFLLGDSEVGKTSLLMQFCESRFEEHFLVTIGVDCKSKHIERNGKKLKLQVWDTAGQERFRTITPAYYRGAMGVIITYDITSRESFDHVEYWVQQLEEHGDAAVQRVLVGNKSDLTDLRKISTEEGEKLATKFNMSFFETSARTGDYVHDAFLLLTDQVVVHRYADAPATTSHSLKLDRERKKRPCC